MNYKKDYLFIKDIIIKLANSRQTSIQTDKTIKEQIKYLASLITLRELYDLHNTNRQIMEIWRQGLEVFEMYKINPDTMGKEIRRLQALLKYTPKEKDVPMAVKTAHIMVDFVNPFGHDKERFIEEITMRTHPTLQQCIGGLLFSVIKAYASPDFMNIDGRNRNLVDRCREIDKFMREHSSIRSDNWDKLPLV